MTLAAVSSLHWLLWERVLMMGSGQMGQIMRSQEREHVCGLRWRRAVGVTCSLYILSWATSNRRVVSLGAVCNDHRDTKNARHITARKYLWHMSLLKCQVNRYQYVCFSTATTWRRRWETSTRSSPSATTWILYLSTRRIVDTSNSRCLLLSDVSTARRVCIAWTMPWQDVCTSVTHRYWV